MSPCGEDSITAKWITFHEKEGENGEEGDMQAGLGCEQQETTRARESGTWGRPLRVRSAAGITSLHCQDILSAPASLGGPGDLASTCSRPGGSFQVPTNLVLLLNFWELLIGFSRTAVGLVFTKAVAGGWIPWGCDRSARPRAFCSGAVVSVCQRLSKGDSAGSRSKPSLRLPKQPMVETLKEKQLQRQMDLLKNVAPLESLLWDKTDSQTLVGQRAT